MSGVWVFDSRGFLALGLEALGVFAHAPWWLLLIGAGWIASHAERGLEVRG